MTKKYIAIVSVFSLALSALSLSNPVFANENRDKESVSTNEQKVGVLKDRLVKREEDKDKEKKFIRMAPATNGIVTVVSGNTITLKDSKNTVWTIDATNAKFYRRYGAEMKITDVQVNDKLQVYGIVSGSNIVAKKIIDESLQAQNGNFTGTVTVISGLSFTLQTVGRGAQTVNTNSDTTFRKNGKPVALSDLVINQKVHVNGVWNTTNNNITAKTVNIIISMVPVRVNGAVQSISDKTLTVRGADNVIYTVDASRAQILDGSGARAKLALVKANDQVVVTGKRDGTSATFTAMRILDITQLLPLDQFPKERE